eukprot:TRINITY_DN29_c0_g1_i5.p1 TRINITY_DN29_c0_g1~~TRINITY_DN29_c0_g1_i5.p1  ORF type:complete len:148 (-),score=41.06 TRINITY_DN29_c0_g1_i5:63-506(-)
MARTRSFLPCLLLASAGVLLMNQMSFVNMPGQAASAPTALRAESSGASSDFDVKSLLDPVDEENSEVQGRSAAFFFAHIGYLIVPLLKGVTLALVFAALAYFAANGALTKNITGENAEAAKSVESVSQAVGRQSAKLWNAVVEKINV